MTGYFNSITSSSFIHVVAYFIAYFRFPPFFFFLKNFLPFWKLNHIPLYMEHILLIYPFIIHGHLGDFYLLGIMNCTIMNMSVKPLFFLPILLSIYPEAEFLDHTIIYFYYFEELPYYFPQQLHILHSHQQSTRVLASPHPLQHLFLSAAVVVFCFFK